MTTLIRRTAMVLTLLAAGCVGSQAVADQPAYYFNPNPPRLGINFQFVQWPVQGYYVEYVYPGSPAHRLGLEYGDIITHVNGYPLTYYGAHQSLLGGSGYFTLTIRNCRWPHNTVSASWPPGPVIGNAWSSGSGVWSSAN
ncbi:MAG: PDZ domain-containing protein [Pirellulales bacterium]|nr:PDZ domain-containing protein [Pirellulales bacterium]